MMALYGGWRQDLNENMKLEGPQLPHETGLNILSKQAMEILKEYEEKLVRLKPSIAPNSADE